MLAVYGPNSVMCTTPNGFAHIVVDNDAAHSLTGNGDPQALLGVLRRGDIFCRGETMVCVIEHDNPKKDKLTSLYERFGFKDIGIIMKRNMKETSKWAE